jgi:hypothetical protein
MRHDRPPRSGPAARLVRRTAPATAAWRAGGVRRPAAATEPVQADPYTVRVGGLEYEGHGHAQPVAVDRLRWTMTYRTMLDGAENSHILLRSGAGC